MRIIDLHCYPGTKEWIACQGPYVEALAKYWKRDWVGKPEDEVVAEFTPEPHHIAFPGVVNGGIIGALLDCHSNWTAAYHLMRASGATSPPFRS